MDQIDCQMRCRSEESMSGRNRNRDFYRNRNFYGSRNFNRNSMNGEEYCESEFMLRNEESCKASSCCQWNTWEEGDASFNGQGRCWSDIGTKMCTDMFEGHGSYSNSYGSRDFYGNHNFYGHRNFQGNHNFYGHRNFYRNSMNGEEYCESKFMLRNEESCKASSCCQWNTWEEGEASFNGQGRC